MQSRPPIEIVEETSVDTIRNIRKSVDFRCKAMPRKNQLPMHLSPRCGAHSRGTGQPYLERRDAKREVQDAPAQHREARDTVPSFTASTRLRRLVSVRLSGWIAKHVALRRLRHPNHRIIVNARETEILLRNAKRHHSSDSAHELERRRGCGDRLMDKGTRHRPHVR